MEDLLGGIDRPGEPSQASLLLDDVDEMASLFDGPVKHVANKLAEAAGRGRGRPKGATNKTSWRDTMLRMGYKHPGENLLAIANADPVQLALELAAMEQGVFGDRVTRMEVTRVELSDLVNRAYALILKANAELMPYFESKRPTQIDVTERKLGLMIVGEMKTERGADDKFIEATSIEKPE